MSKVQLQNVKKSFGDLTVLHGISMGIEDREFVVFVGPSGCGKSTLLRTVAGLEALNGGQVFIGDRDVTHVAPAQRGVAMVFQSYALYPHMTVAQNIGFGLKVAKTPRDQIRQRVQDAAEVLQIQNLLQRKPRELSGGQRQRVAIGRAIVRDPDVFLFDEPLSNLDAALRAQMRLELIKLHRKLKATMIYVTHDQTEAMTMADRIVVLNQGRIEQVGRPMELYHRPDNRFVAGFIGSPKMNFLTVQATRTDNSGVTVRLPGNVELTVPVHGAKLGPEAELTLGVRPEHVRIRDTGDSDAWLPGQVTVVEHLGGSATVHAQLANHSTLELLAPGDEAFAPGDPIRVGLPAANCHLFEDNDRTLTRLDGGGTAKADAPPKHAPPPRSRAAQ